MHQGVRTIWMPMSVTTQKTLGNRLYERAHKPQTKNNPSHKKNVDADAYYPLNILNLLSAKPFVMNAIIPLRRPQIRPTPGGSHSKPLELSLQSCRRLFSCCSFFFYYFQMSSYWDAVKQIAEIQKIKEEKESLLLFFPPQQRQKSTI